MQMDGTGETDLLIKATDLAAGYGETEVLRGVDLRLRRGDFVGLIGPNGSGKTTLLHCVCGIHPLRRGAVRLAGEDLSGLSRTQVARLVALVPQFSWVGVEVTVEEVVAQGRYPWRGRLGRFGEEDFLAVEGALEAMGLIGLRGRSFHALSGGERQRVILARALAQRTPVILLDEPVAGLDLGYQQETYERLAALAKEGRAVLVADHHLNLTSAWCSRLLVLAQGRITRQGPPAQVLSAQTVSEVFGARVSIVESSPGVPQCVWSR